jgi:hypothetical protein
VRFTKIAHVQPTVLSDLSLLVSLTISMELRSITKAAR